MVDVDWAIDLPDLTIRPLSPAAILVLRLRRPDDRLMKRVGDVLGHALPVIPNRIEGDAPRSVWLAPGEWMIVGNPDLLPRLEEAIGDATGHVSDVTAGRHQFVISGNLAAALLAKGTSIDLHPDILAAGTSAQTLFAQLRVLIERPREKPDSFILTADISVADYLQRWFDDAAIEFRPR